MKTGIVRSTVLLSSALVLAASGQKEISYKADIQPILQTYCVECHVEGGKATKRAACS